MRGVLSHMAGFTAPVRRLLLKIQLVVREYTALSPATMRAITANTIRMSRLERRDRAVEASPARPVAAGQFLGGEEAGTSILPGNDEFYGGGPVRI